MDDRWRTWLNLMEPEAAPLREAAARLSSPTPADIARLRKHGDAARVAAALELADARRRAADKFTPGHAARLVADTVGVEQATDHAIAGWKASRLVDARRSEETPPGAVLDLCCGIGGDAMAMVDAGLSVIAVDRDPVRAWMASRNSGAPALVADAARLPLEPRALGGCAIHLDPARRDEAGARRHTVEQMQPGPDVVRKLVASAAIGVVKLGPGVDRADAASLAPDDRPVEIEWIAARGVVRQAVLWVAGPASGQTRATRVDDRCSIAGSPRPLPPPGVVGPCLVTVDPALLRAGLLHEVPEARALRRLHAGLPLLTGPAPPASPWLKGYPILEQIPWRLELVKRSLQGLGAGEVTVKTMGRAVDPDRVAPALRGDGRRPMTVFVLRLGRPLRAFITEPTPTP